VRPLPDVHVALGDRAYDVHVGEGIVSSLGRLCIESGLASHATVVIAEGLVPTWLEGLKSTFEAVGPVPRVIEAPDGEKHKNLPSVRQLYRHLTILQHERSEPIIAVGGGTIGDVAGFVAATYLRGVPLVHVPTTLLAQVDSAIGGKTGVNLEAGKNLVGAFWQPRLVVCDTRFLASLPPPQIASGLAEVAKYGCIARPELLTAVRERLTDLQADRPRVEPQLVADCVAIKAGVVSGDERESDRRRILNFGHTFGHALEAATDYQELSHGEAVALGMLVALELSHTRLKLPRVDGDRVCELLRAIFPALTFPEIPFARLADTMARDKKVKEGRSIWVLLQKLGQPVIATIPDLQEVEAAAQTARERWNLTAGKRQ
jgi:3-dehydroquinate synthase